MQGAFLSEGDADFELLDSDDEYSDNSNDSEKEKVPKLNPATQKLQENETPTLPNHQETQSDQAKPFTCQFCKKTFKLNGRLKIHLKSKKCQKQNQKNPKRSEQNMEDSIENAVDLSKDEFVKPKPAKIARIEVQKQNNKLNYQCHKCTKTFEEKDKITDHITFEHSKIICDVCGKLFEQISALKKHFSNDHLIQNISCDKCDIIFLTQELLNEHKLMVHEDAKCVKCDKTFTYLELRNHIGQRVSCKTCRADFCTNNGLSFHLLKSHPNHQASIKSSEKFQKAKEPPKQFNVRMKCDLCDKEFKQFSSLKSHMSADHLTKCLKCDKCEETFFEESYLLDHEFLMHEIDEIVETEIAKASKKTSKEEAASNSPAVQDYDNPTVADVCENFSLNDIDLEYMDADYQNLTTYKLFQQKYKSMIRAANTKVPMPKLMMLVAAKWREFQASNPNEEF